MYNIITRYNAVANAIRPNIIPGAFANATGISLFGFFSSPYVTHKAQLIAATSGCIGLPLCPARLSAICGMYDTYIPIAVAVATQLKIVKNFPFSSCIYFI